MWSKKKIKGNSVVMMLAYDCLSVWICVVILRPFLHESCLTFDGDVRIDNRRRLPFITKNVIQKVLISCTDRNHIVQMCIWLNVQRKTCKKMHIYFSMRRTFNGRKETKWNYPLKSHAVLQMAWMAWLALYLEYGTPHYHLHPA